MVANGRLDPLSIAWYELTFRYKYVTAEGDAFQNLFENLMERAHRHDFTRVQPWGRYGDCKCDGYLTSQRMVFACYGPKEFDPLPRALEKVASDHAGAITHWKRYMDAWTFVHNEHRGLPAKLLQLLVDLKKIDTAISVTHWGEPELSAKVRTLQLDDLVALFGGVPTSRDVMNVRQEDLRRVIPALAGAVAAGPPIQDLRPVPPEKLQYNKLSDQARLFLLQGMQVSDRVRTFFEQWDPGVGDRIAAAFRERYRQLADQGSLSPDEVLWSLYGFAGQGHLTSTKEQAAVLALLAFLFESCEIFDRPPDAASV